MGQGQLKAHCDRSRYLLLRFYPELGFQPTTPWLKMQTLVDVVSATDGLIKINKPIVDGNFAYALGEEVDATAGKAFLRLLRWSLESGELTKFDRVESGKYIPNRYRGYSYEGSFDCAAVADGKYFYSRGFGGIWVFPTDGGKVEQLREAEGLPTDIVQSFAILDGKLYAALGGTQLTASGGRSDLIHSGSFLVAYDLKTRACDVLVSTRRKEKQSPFDDGPPFVATLVVADTARHRIVFLGGNSSRREAQQIAAAGTPSGIWEYGAKEKMFRFLSSVPVERWGHYHSAEQRILTGVRDLWSFDLAKDRLELFYTAAYPDVWWKMLAQTYPEIKSNRSSRMMDGSLLLHPPYVLLDGWLWSASPWGRIRLDGTNQEYFSSLRTKETPDYFLYPTTCIEPIANGRRLLVGDHYGLWLLDLKKE